MSPFPTNMAWLSKKPITTYFFDKVLWKRDKLRSRSLLLLPRIVSAWEKNNITVFDNLIDMFVESETNRLKISFLKEIRAKVCRLSY